MQHYIVHPKFEELFQKNQLTSTSDILNFKDVTYLRTLSMRANIYFKLQDETQQLGFYLKTHQPLPFRQALKMYLGSKQARPQGWVEWEKIHQLSQYVPTMTPVATGVEAGRWGRYTGKSFCITEELYGYIQLDHYLREHPLTKELIQQVGKIAQQFHAARFSHKDFYLCHWFYHPETKHLALIDLQRLSRPFFFSRWRIKDIAELYYSTQVLSIKKTDKLRFLYTYLNIPFHTKLSSVHKTFIRKVLRKSEQILKHNRGYK